MSDVDAWAGPWKLSGDWPNRKLTRMDDGEVREWLFEDGDNQQADIADIVFQQKLAEIKKEHGKFSVRLAEPAVEKTTTEVKEVVYGPIDTANDAIIIAHLINEKFDLDEGEVYEAVTRKTTVTTTIL